MLQGGHVPVSGQLTGIYYRVLLCEYPEKNKLVKFSRKCPKLLREFTGHYFHFKNIDVNAGVWVCKQSMRTNQRKT